jgi:cation diffusion facilitator CzcD-associated flavoprotein CzcO
VLAKHDPPAGRLWQAARRRLPLLRRAGRGWLYWAHESRMLGFGWFPALMTGLERRARSHAKTQLDNPALRERLTPADRIGCKRILLSNDYFPSLNRPNVALVTAPIARIAADAVITADGTRHPADVLIYATGFQATDPLGGIAITGRDGVTLAEAWAGRMRARLGLAVPGFPNMFLLAGPNTGLGHNSLVFMLEAQIGHILRCLRLRRSAGAREIEVRAEAEAGFTARLDARMARTVWLSGCRSWYLDRQGRNTTLWPGFSIGYWWRARRVSRRDYALR